MALPVTIPNQFDSATASIPLSQLDTNFNTLANAVNGISDGSETLANVTATVVNATTVDTTNIEVTNIKAKDGTAAGSIADSTGVVTLASSVLTTTDINGGTIDGTAIGGASAAAGAFTTLNTSGAVVFNDAGADVDFRVESDTVDHALFVEGSSGNVGIGTSSPGTTLDVRGRVTSQADNAYYRIRRASAADVGYVTDSGTWGDSGTDFAIGASSSNLRFYTNNSATERMRIDSAGNVGIGTSSPAAPLDVRTSGTSGVEASLADFFAGSTAGLRVFVTPSSSGAGSVTRLYADSGGDFDTSSSIAFDTRNAGTRAERMRIDSSGNLLVGTTSVLGSAKATFKAGSTLPGISIGMANSAGTYAAQIFFDGDNTDSGSIDVNNNANTTAYTTSSDYRLKINVQPIANALDKVSQLNPVTWNWKKNPALSSSGFIAHELQVVCPDAVTGKKDDVDAEGKPQYQGIDTSFLVATLTAAIQEQQAIINDLKARLDAANL
jgi:hypothetical protein